MAKRRLLYTREIRPRGDVWAVTVPNCLFAFFNYRFCRGLRFVGTTSNLYDKNLSLVPHQLLRIRKRIPAVKHALRKTAGTQWHILIFYVAVHLEAISVGRAVHRQSRQDNTSVLRDTLAQLQIFFVNVIFWNICWRSRLSATAMLYTKNSSKYFRILVFLATTVQDTTWK